MLYRVKPFHLHNAAKSLAQKEYHEFRKERTVIDRVGQTREIGYNLVILV